MKPLFLDSRDSLVTPAALDAGDVAIPAPLGDVPVTSRGIDRTTSGVLGVSSGASGSRTDRNGRPPRRLGAGAYGEDMADEQIHQNIEQLVAEEHELWDREAAGAATEADRRRLEEVRVSLDQCWDLLRQRRALREFDRDPADASVRSEETVERYQQ